MVKFKTVAAANAVYEQIDGMEFEDFFFFFQPYLADSNLLAATCCIAVIAYLSIKDHSKF